MSHHQRLTDELLREAYPATNEEMMMMIKTKQTMSTCRFCKQGEGGDHYRMIKYEVRHYAHADCGLKAKGVEFLAHLTDWQCTQFPYLAAHEAGQAVIEELKRRCAKHDAAERRSDTPLQARVRAELASPDPRKRLLPRRR